jgi:hypothetical protein
MRDFSSISAKSGLSSMPCSILLSADNIVLNSPLCHSPQKLLDMCCDAASAHDIKFQVAKCASVIFLPISVNSRVLPNFVLKGYALKVMEICVTSYHLFAMMILISFNRDVCCFRGQIFSSENYLTAVSE